MVIAIAASACGAAPADESFDTASAESKRRGATGDAGPDVAVAPPNDGAVGAVGTRSACSTASASYYVATTGNDSNQGTTPAAAFLTINAAIRAAHPGDVIQIEPGNYAGFTIWNGTGSAPAAAGTASQHFTLRGNPAHPRGSVIIGSSWFWGNYWDICHLRITNNAPSASTKGGLSGGYGTGPWAMSSYIHVDDVELDHAWGSGFRAFAPASHVTLSNSYVHDNCMENKGGVLQQGATLWDNGVTLDDTTDSLVENNLVENNWGEGIDIIGRNVTAPMNNVVRGNTIHNAYSVLMYNDHATSNVWIGNFAYNDDPAFYRSGNPAAGMQIADESAPRGGPGSSGLVVANNIIYGANQGFRYGAYGLALGLRNVSVYGNTIVSSKAGGLWIDAAPGTANTLILDNIVRSTTGVAAYVPKPAGITFGHNAWSGVLSGMQTGAGDLTANPQLVGESDWKSTYRTPKSYVPLATSPVKRAGVAVTGWTTDFFGTPRFNPPSLGAAEPAP